MQGVTTQPARPLDGMLYDEVFAVPGEGHIVDCVNPLTDRSCIYGETLDELRLRYPNAVRLTWEEWRAGQIERQNRPVVWTRVTEEQYREMLEVLPPIDWDGGSFMVGEASDHSYETGKPRFQAYAFLSGGIYVMASRPMTRLEFRTERLRIVESEDK